LRRTEIKSKSRLEPCASRLRSQFRSWHASACSLDDKQLDRSLGIRVAKIERTLDASKLMLEFENEHLIYSPTPYDVIRNTMRALNPSSRDTFYDLGAGYGRVLFYGALTHSATFRGIELVRDRVHEANRVKRALALRTLDFRQGNAQTADFSDGNIFFLFNPFFLEVLSVVGLRLRRLATHRQIQIVSVANSNQYFAGQSCLDASRSCFPRVRSGRS
jgi:SAM-dependent methyltransferase